MKHPTNTKDSRQEKMYKNLDEAIAEDVLGNPRPEVPPWAGRELAGWTDCIEHEGWFLCKAGGAPKVQAIPVSKNMDYCDRYLIKPLTAAVGPGGDNHELAIGTDGVLYTAAWDPSKPWSGVYGSGSMPRAVALAALNLARNLEAYVRQPEEPWIAEVIETEDGPVQIGRPFAWFPIKRG